MSIQLLSSEVVNQIAAGEVVERPAHMVKELLENSMDAGADRIEIEIADGGRSLSIIDNGHGIGADQLHLALARHATSKIQNVSDLWRLRSFGFRGEALASIAAVSRLSLISRPRGESKASRIDSEFGVLSPVVSSGGAEGTQVLIKDLFANIPARLKFLKSPAAELGQIKNVVKAMAMAHPKVRISAKYEGKLLFLWPASEDLTSRIEQILEHKPLYATSHEMDDFKVEAVIGSPHMVSKQARQIWIFVQGRWVQDRALQAAVMEGYRNLLMHGEYPVAAIFINCDPEDVDVNIHPSKSQVKFVDPQKAFRATVAAVRQGLSLAPWLESGAVNVAPSFASTPREFSAPAQSLEFSDPRFSDISFKTKTLGQIPTGKVMETLRQYSPTPSAREGEKYSPRPSENSISNQDPRSPHASQERQSTSSSESLQDTRPKSSFWSRLHVLGQAHLTYILAQSEERLYLIDQHAAHERVAFEKLMAAWKGGRLDVQAYLVPLVLDLDEVLIETLVHLAGELKKMGVELEQLAPGSVAISAAPAMLSEKSLSFALEKMARENLERGGSFALEKVIADLCATMACHSVVRAGQSLSYEEMVSLLEQMDEFSFSSFCPHGRPVSIDFEFSRIERDFGRIV